MIKQGFCIALSLLAGSPPLPLPTPVYVEGYNISLQLELSLSVGTMSFTEFVNSDIVLGTWHIYTGQQQTKEMWTLSPQGLPSNSGDK